MDQNLVRLLEDAGFTEKEAGVYLALLELNRGTVTEIAKTTSLKRPIIYVVLEGLIKRGYVSEVPDAKILAYKPIDPLVILQKLKSTTQNFSEMLPFLKSLGNSGKKKPKITYIDTLKGIWNVYDEISAAPEAFYITSYIRIEDYFPGAIEKWLKYVRRNKVKQIARHLIANDSREFEHARRIKNESKEDIRVMKNVDSLAMDFTLYGNKVALTSLSDEPFIVVIESEGLANSLRSIFEILWKSALPLE